MSDADRAVSLAYGAADGSDARYPARISYVIDAGGRIAKVYAKVDPATHPQEVYEDLKKSKL